MKETLFLVLLGKKKNVLFCLASLEGRHFFGHRAAHRDLSLAPFRVGVHPFVVIKHLFDVAGFTGRL